MGIHCQPVGLGGGWQGGRQGLGALAQVLVLVVFGLNLGALGELQPDPLAGLRLARQVVLLPGLAGGPLDGTILLGQAATWTWRELTARERKFE